MKKSCNRLSVSEWVMMVIFATSSCMIGTSGFLFPYRISSSVIRRRIAFTNHPDMNSKSGIYSSKLDGTVVHNMTNNQTTVSIPPQEEVSLYRSEGIFAVDKPLNWTSNDVVSYIKGILERDARNRGANPAKGFRKNKKKIIKVGHGGTLDPLGTFS